MYPLNLKFTVTKIFSTLVAESEEELKSLLIKVKEESEKTGLKLNIQKKKTNKKKQNKQKKTSTFRKLRSWHPVPSLHDK